MAKALIAVFGLMSIVVGVLLIVYPIHGVRDVILFIGIYAVVVGILRIIFGFLIRLWAGRPSTPAAA